jgi:hypothetical protein
MSKKQKMGVLVWLVLFVLSVFFILIIPSRYTSGVIMTLIFTLIAYASTLGLWISLLKKMAISSDAFYYSSSITVSILYLIIQLLVCVLQGLLVDVISLKTTVILNVLLMTIMWFLILSTIILKNHSKQVDSRQKNHHIEL